MATRILLVEDNPLNLKLLKDLLEYHGHDIRTATSVDEALRIFEAYPFQIVVADIQIPGGGGERLLREIRSRSANARLPILAVTAQAMAGDRERILNAGFDGYFSKPIDTRTLVKAIESYLEKPTPTA